MLPTGRNIYPESTSWPKSRTRGCPSRCLWCCSKISRRSCLFRQNSVRGPTISMPQRQNSNGVCFGHHSKGVIQCYRLGEIYPLCQHLGRNQGQEIVTLGLYVAAQESFKRHLLSDSRIGTFFWKFMPWLSPNLRTYKKIHPWVSKRTMQLTNFPCL